jgi:hypothetical protein
LGNTSGSILLRSGCKGMRRWGITKQVCCLGSSRDVADTSLSTNINIYVHSLLEAVRNKYRGVWCRKIRVAASVRPGSTFTALPTKKTPVPKGDGEARRNTNGQPGPSASRTVQLEGTQLLYHRIRCVDMSTTEARDIVQGEQRYALS